MTAVAYDLDLAGRLLAMASKVKRKSSTLLVKDLESLLIEAASRLALKGTE